MGFRLSLDVSFKIVRSHDEVRDRDALSIASDSGDEEYSDDESVDVHSSNSEAWVTDSDSDYEGCRC